MLRLVVFLILLQHAHSVCMVTPDANGHVSAEALSAKLNGMTIIGSMYTNYRDQYFHGCTTLKSIDIPASVETIGYYAFYNSYVAKVSYNGTDMSLLQLQNELGTRAYNSGADTTGVTVYGSSDRSFYLTPYANCPLANKTASHGIYTGNSMRYCKWMTSVTIPSSVISIGSWAFYETTNLKSVDFSGATNLTEIGSYAFASATALTSIDLRQATKLRTIGANAFYYYQLSGFLFLPATFFDVDGADTMLSAAILYANIYGLRHCMVTPDSNGHVNATALSANLINNSLGLGFRLRWVTGFYKCNTLKSIEIPATVTSIGASAFYGTDLTTVIIPESVKTIGGTGAGAYGAFGYNDITELAILGTPTFYEYSSSSYSFRTFQRKSGGSLQLKRFCGNYSALPVFIQSQISLSGAVTDCTFWCATGSGQISTNYHCTKQWSTSCAAGSYFTPKPAGMQVSMSDTCTPCPTGTFQSIPGSNATSCTTCPTGMFQPNSSSVACDQPWSTCSQGQYWTAGSTTVDATCTPCPAGTYQPDDNSNATECTACPSGSFSTSSSVACTPWSTCSQGHHVVVGSTIVDATCTACPAGTYQPDDNSNATECTAWTPVDSAVYVGKVLVSLGTATADHQWGDIPALTTYHPNDLKAALDTRCAL